MTHTLHLAEELGGQSKQTAEPPTRCPECEGHMPPIPYGPNNPHPLSQLTTELVWEGKYDEYGNQSR